ncbi:hypothetical protein ACEWY4_004617 [Coilia grayii]|uniref:Ig-like domain-containing protein n=1 Tax=Coilia grayii TaxID=363190 RepID=A0ABD1KM76_9TELE
MMDMVPGISQAKSLLQLICGDSGGAAQTQENFLKGFPICSQGVSVYQYLKGDTAGALDTQKQFVQCLNGMANSTVGLGQIKAAVHYLCGDTDGSKNAFKASCRSTSVMVSGVVGFLVGGPVGAVVGGNTAGLAVDSYNSEEGKPSGILRIREQISKNPTDVGLYADLVWSLSMDGLAGLSAGNGLGKKIQYEIDKSDFIDVMGEDVTEQIIKDGESMTQTTKQLKPNKPFVKTRTIDKVTEETFTGINKQARETLKNNDHMTDGPTELQIRVPGAKQDVPNRRPQSCAEQQAYNALYKKRPDARPNEIKSYTLRYDKTKGPVTVKRCGNCKAFASAMGDVITDEMADGTPVPVNVSGQTVLTSSTTAIAVQGCVGDDSSRSPAFEISLSETTVAVGEEVVLKCTANIEDLQVTWEKNGRELHAGDRVSITRNGRVLSLRIGNAAPTDGGIYTVKLKNRKGRASTSATVNILNSSPSPAFEIPLSETTVAVGEEVVLKCTANIEDLQVTWEKNGRELHAGDRVSITRNGRVLSLRIRNAAPTDRESFHWRYGDH